MNTRQTIGKTFVFRIENKKTEENPMKIGKNVFFFFKLELPFCWPPTSIHRIHLSEMFDLFSFLAAPLKDCATIGFRLALVILVVSVFFFQGPSYWRGIRWNRSKRFRPQTTRPLVHRKRKKKGRFWKLPERPGELPNIRKLDDVSGIFRATFGGVSIG